MTTTIATVDFNDTICRGDAMTLSTSTTSINDSKVTTALISVLTFFLSLLIVIGNGLIIVSVLMVKKLRQPANYLIVSLALSDFLVGFIVLPLTIVYDIVGEWVFGPMICDVHVCFDVICCTASIMNLCMISIDRYLMITQPMVYPKQRTGKLMAILIATAWLISCVIIIPALFGFTQNVKDEPDWLELSPDSIVQESGNLVVGSSYLNQSFWNGSHSASAAIDGNDLTFWDPGTSSISSQEWYFVLDLKQLYKLSKVSLRNAGDEMHDVRQYNFEVNICSTLQSWQTEKVIEIKSGIQDTQESIITTDLESRYVRMRVNKTYGEAQPKIKEFRLFGEKVNGKACLISQEMWFTIYSTVGSFYLPLTIMLCMYWKIYREASKFNARHRKRSASYSNSQEWSVIAPSTSDVTGSGRNPISLQIFGSYSKRSVNQKNYSISTTEKVKLIKNRRSEDYVMKSHKQHLPRTNFNGVSATGTNKNENEKGIKAMFDHNNPSSECGLLAGVKISKNGQDRTISDKSLTECNNFSNVKMKNNISENLELDSETLSDRSLSQTLERKTVSYSELPPNSVSNETNKGSDCNIKSEALFENSRRLSQASNDFNRSHSPCVTHSNSTSLSNGLNSGEYRFPTISENNILELNEINCSQIVCDSSEDTHFLADNHITTKRKASWTRPLYTRSSSLCRNVEESFTNTHESESAKSSQLSVLMSSLPNYGKPQFNRTTSLPSRSTPVYETTNFWNGKQYNDNYKASLPSKNAYLSRSAHNCSGKSNGRNNQGKGRLSSTSSRDRMRNVKATRTLGIIVGAFTFCWLPFFIVTFLRPFVCEQPESQNCIPLWLVRLVLWLGYLNSALNPLIYIGFSPDLRETFRLLISCQCANVDRRLAQTELRQAVSRERRISTTSRAMVEAESIMVLQKQLEEDGTVGNIDTNILNNLACRFLKQRTIYMDKNTVGKQSHRALTLPDEMKPQDNNNVQITKLSIVFNEKYDKAF